MTIAKHLVCMTEYVGDLVVVVNGIRIPTEQEFIRPSIGITHTDDLLFREGHASESLPIHNDGHGLETLIGDEDIEVENRCVECNVDLGSCNPRQLCGKTRCDNQY